MNARVLLLAVLFPAAFLLMAHAAGAALGETAPAGSEDAGKTFVPQKAMRQAVLTAFTRPRTVMTLVSEESGVCRDVLADVGDAIGPDGIFARLDDAFILLDLEKNQAEQRRLEADFDFYAKEVGRYERLVGKDSAARRDLEDEARVLAGTRNNLEGLRIEEKNLREHLSRYVLRAPPGWKVMSRELEPGEWVRSGDETAKLGRFDRLRVPFALTVAELKAVKAVNGGLTLELTDLGITVPAVIDRIAPDFEPDTRKITVDLAIDNADGALRGGLRADLTVNMPDPAGALLAPKTSLLKTYEEYFLVRPNGERVKAVLLGDGPNGQVRIRAEDARPGEAFLADPGA